MHYACLFEGGGNSRLQRYAKSSLFGTCAQPIVGLAGQGFRIVELMLVREATAIHVADTSVLPANSTLPSKSCPALISPTPAGVPVIIMSPSSRVVKVSSSLIICTGVYIIRACTACLPLLAVYVQLQRQTFNVFWEGDKRTEQRGAIEGFGSLPRQSFCL